MQLKKQINLFNNQPINGKLLYLISFCGIIFCDFILMTTFSSAIPAKYLNWSIDLFMLPAMFKLFLIDKHKLPEWLTIVFVLSLAFVSWRKSGYNMMFVMAVLVMSASGIDFRKLIEVYFKILLSLFLMVIAYSLVGIIDNLVYYRNAIPRYALGINYPTDCAALVFSLVLAYCYTYYKKLNLTQYIGIFVIAYLVKYFTDVRLDTILIVLIVPVLAIAKKAQIDKDPFSTCVSTTYWGSIPMLAFVAIYSSYFYDSSNHIYLKFDRILSGRLQLSHRGLNEYGIHLFGQKIQEFGWGGNKGLNMMMHSPNQYFFIDSAYLRMFIVCGIVVSMVFLISNVVLAMRETRNNSYILPAVILMFSISAMIDQHFIEIVYNPFLIALVANVEKGDKDGKNY
ncbi:MAG: hypothetical protein Q3959_01430 [Limosilactobacillus sp.]|uniref:hypothetical protein n=1 Tax=Limosilactobacillus sp. TaxID=2773925 RepID=UPI00270122AD|nr:hypothetical protein [Limosilactobacillus sp.]